MADPNPAGAPAANGANQGALAQRADPYRAYNFALEIDGKTEGHFTHCGGLGVRVTPIRYREGGDARTVHFLAGPVEYGEITLRYGLSDSRLLWDWIMSAVGGLPQRKDISLIMQGPDGTAERLRWNLFDTWPCEWRGAPLDALGKEFAIESLTLVCERIERA
jgi:phage tail-like protein